MKKKLCEQCGKPFARPPRRSATQWATARFCTRRCAARGMATQLRTHGATTRLGKSPTYQSWLAMKSRCLNPNATHYADYGGRGIAVCERWRSDFAHFLADMGERPDGRTLHRIDNDRGYEPSNCRWATRMEQAQNRRAMRVWIVQGWDEEPRGVFSSEAVAREFVEAQADYEVRQLAEDGTGSDCYPFIFEHEVHSQATREEQRRSHA